MQKVKILTNGTSCGDSYIDHNIGIYSCAPSKRIRRYPNVQESIHDIPHPDETSKTDSQRVRALVIIAQQSMPNALRFSGELHQIIHQYSDHNEIRTLFPVLKSPEGRKEAFTIESYEATHRRYWFGARKAKYLKTLGIRSICDTLRGPEPHAKMWFKIILHQNNGSIQKIEVGGYLFPEEDDQAFSQDARVGQASLEALKLMYHGSDVSMIGIRKFPDTLRSLEIDSWYWSDSPDDVDLRLRPRRLQALAAANCQGRNGTLVQLQVVDPGIRVHVDSIVQLLGKKGVRMRQP